MPITTIHLFHLHLLMTAFRFLQVCWYSLAFSRTLSLPCMHWYYQCNWLALDLRWSVSSIHQYTSPDFLRGCCQGIVAYQVTVTVCTIFCAVAFTLIPVGTESLSHSLARITASSLSGSSLLITRLPAFVGAVNIVRLSVKRMQLWSLPDSSSSTTQPWSDGLGFQRQRSHLCETQTLGGSGLDRHCCSWLSAYCGKLKLSAPFLLYSSLYTISKTNFSAKKCVSVEPIHEQRTAFYTLFVYSSFVRTKIV